MDAGEPCNDISELLLYNELDWLLIVILPFTNCNSLYFLCFKFNQNQLWESEVEAMQKHDAWAIFHDPAESIRDLTKSLQLEICEVMFRDKYPSCTR